MIIPLLIIVCIYAAIQSKHKVSVMTPEKRRAMYPPIEKQYLSRKAEGFILGKAGSNYVRVPLDPDNIMHAVIVGSPGSGKSSGPFLCTLIANFMKNPPPMQVFCLDIKPELAKKSVELYGNPHVRVVNPTDRNSWGWNVYYELNSNSSESDIVKVVEGIARVLIVTENDKNAFFSNSARNMFTGMMVFYYRQGLGFIDSILIIMSEDIQSQIQKILSDKTSCPDHCRVRQYLAEFSDGESDALNDIKMTLKEHLNIFTDPDVIWNLRDNSEKACPFDFDEGMSVFISIPEPFLNYGNALLRMYIHQTLDYCEKHRTEKSKPLAVILDEFPRLGKIERVISGGALSTLRSRRVSIWTAMQDLSQIEKVYSDREARSLLALSEIHVICSCNDIPTIEAYSKRAGEYRQIRYTHSKGYRSNSTNVSYENRRIIDPADVMSLRKSKEVILFLEGRYLRVKRCRYFEDKVLNKRNKRIREINESR